jgi:hypothetical protein
MDYCRLKRILLQAWSRLTPGRLDWEAGWSTGKHPKDGRANAGICPESRNH